jgi:hypothetical protein
MKNIVGIATSLALILFLTLGAASAATSSKTQVYINNADDDNLWIKFYLDGGYMSSKMAFQNTTKYFAFYKLSEGPHELKIEWKDPDTCVWQEKTKTVEADGEDITATISVVPNSESTCKKAEPAKKSTSYGSLDISVRNIDDDNLFVMLFINGERRKERTVGRNSTTQFMKIFSLAQGSYNIAIRWKEPDTNKWHEKTQVVTVNEGNNYITLETDEIIYTHEFTKPTSAIDIYVKNVDDDDLWVDVFVDSGYALKYVRSGTKRHIRNFDKLYQGKHTVRLRWIDPDVARWQERRFVVNLGADEEASRTFHTVKNTR